MFDKLKQAANSVSESALSSVASASGAGVEKLRTSVCDLLAGVHVIRRCGYVARGISLKLGLSPEVAIKLEHLDGAHEEIDIVMLDAPNETVKAFLSALKGVHAIHEGFQAIKGLQSSELQISLGLSPSIGMAFRIDNEIALGQPLLQGPAA